MASFRRNRHAPRRPERGTAPPARPRLELLEDRSTPASFVVNSLGDAPDPAPGDGSADTGGGAVTLRSAIMEALAEAGPQTITFSVTGTIDLGSALPTLTPGDTLTSFSISGPGAGSLTVERASGAGNFRIFQVGSGETVSLSGMTVKGGVADMGGGILNQGNLTVSDCTITGNSATASGLQHGGGLANLAYGSDASLTIQRCVITGNSASREGGGVGNLTFTANTATLTVKDSTFSNNTATNFGGAAANYGQAGGTANASFTNTTFSGNSAGFDAGAISSVPVNAGNATTLTLTNCTVSGNNSSSGTGGISCYAGNSSGTPAIILSNTIIAGNTRGGSESDINQSGAVVSSNGGNVIGSNAGLSFVSGQPSDLIGTASSPIDPLLGPLVDNGGPTPTMALLPGSPALNRAVSAFAPAADQRGVSRPQNGAPDSGAFEARTFTLTVIGGSGQSTEVATNFTNPLQVQVKEGSNPLRGVSVTFTAPSSGPSVGLSPSQGSFGGSTTLTVTTDSAGIASVPGLTANTLPGSYAVSATAAGGLSGSFTLTNTPGPASSFTISNPGTVTAGVPFSVTVSAFDAYGNPTSNYDGTFSFASDDPQATLPQHVTLVNGTGTFPVTLRTAGTHSLTITDDSNPELVGTRSGIAVGAGPGVVALTGLAGTAIAGDVQTFTVRLLDAFGNPASGTVRFSSSDPQAELPGPFTFTASGTGSQTFSVRFKTAGTQTLSVSLDGSSAAPASASVAVVPGAAVRFAVTSLTSDQEGDVLPVTVTAFDAFGNVATGYTGTVAFHSSDPLAVLPPATAFGPGDAGTHAFSVALRTAGPQAILVADQANPAVAGSVAVAVGDVAPAVQFSVHALFNIDSGLNGSGTITDPGNGPWTVRIDYGDGTAPQTLTVGEDRTFQFDHAYGTEGTFTLTITVADPSGATGTSTQVVHSMLPGISVVEVAEAGPGGSATLTVGGATATLIRGDGSTGEAFVLLAEVPLVVTAFLPAKLTPGQVPLISWDLRLFGISDSDRVEVVFTYPPTADGSAPQLKFFDPVSGQYQPVHGSQMRDNSFVIDPVAHTITVIFDPTSFPDLDALTGSVLVISGPSSDSPPPPPTTFVVTGPSNSSAGTNDDPGFQSSRSSGFSSDSQSSFVISSSRATLTPGQPWDSQEQTTKYAQAVVETFRRAYGALLRWWGTAVRPFAVGEAPRTPDAAEAPAPAPPAVRPGAQAEPPAPPAGPGSQLVEPEWEVPLLEGVALTPEPAYAPPTQPEPEARPVGRLESAALALMLGYGGILLQRREGED